MKKPIFLFIIIALLAGVSFFGLSRRNALPKELEVHFIDIGQGDAILVRTVNGKNMLIDSGSSKESARLLDYLQGEGIRSLDVVIATHPDEDHIGAMATVLQKYPVGTFYMPSKEHSTVSYEQLLATLEQKRITVSEAFAGDTIRLDENVELLVLNPSNRQYTNNNEYSIATKLTYFDNSFLFTGDISAVNEYQMISAFGDTLDSDILKLSHHGSSDSNSPDFVRAVSPIAAVASAGIGNDYGHPHDSVCKMLEDFGIPLYRTDEQGNLIFFSDGTNIHVNSAEPGSYR